MQSRIFRLAIILQELASEKRRLAEQSSELQAHGKTAVAHSSPDTRGRL
jgi:hypothetical protein